jgi:tRNA threonylcarbamoyladenosine biosynthesis protein TsaB
MASILNIETATSVCSVAISVNGKIVASLESDEHNVHAEKLAPFIEEALKQASLNFSKLDAIAVGSGPGSYTGLRIGTSTAKGLCFGLNKPLTAVPTLKAMALAAITSLPKSPIEGRLGVLFCPMIDARRLEVYTALFDNTGKEILPVHARILDENSFSEYLKDHALAFFGDGMAKMKELMAPLNLPTRGDFIWLDDIKATATNMASLAEAAYNSSQFSDLAYYEPFYLKDFVAKKKQGIIP